MSNQIVIMAKGLVDVVAKELRRHVTIVVEEDKIAGIFDSGAEPDHQPDAKIIDQSDSYLLPGLINSHVHLGWEAERHVGLDPEYQEYFKDLTVLTSARNGQKELLSGVTTARDCGGWNMPAILRADKLGLVEGPRIFHCGRLITMTGGHCWHVGEEADSPDGVRGAVRQNLKEGADFIKLMATGGGTPHTFPGHASYSVAEIVAATETAHRIDKKVAVHARGTAGIVNAIAGDVDSIEHACFEQPDRTLNYDHEIAESIAESGIYVTPTIFLYRDAFRILKQKAEEGPLPPVEQEFLDRLPRVLEEKYRALVGFKKLGVKCMAGNDAGIPGIEFGGFYRELETLVEGGFSPMDAIESATTIPAEFMGLDDKIGSLAPGKQADIIAVADDPTEHIATLGKTLLVMKDGKIMTPKNQ